MKRFIRIVVQAIVSPMRMPPVDPELDYERPAIDPARVLSVGNLETIRAHRRDPPIEETAEKLDLDITIHEVVSYDGEPIVVGIPAAWIDGHRPCVRIWGQEQTRICECGLGVFHGFTWWNPTAALSGPRLRRPTAWGVRSDARGANIDKAPRCTHDS